MTNEELKMRFSCGEIEAEYENSKWVSLFMQLVFMFVGMYFFWTMLSESTFAGRLDNIAVLFFCLWRIHRQRDIICYAAAKGIIVRRQFMSLSEFYNDQFHEIELGHAEDGGIAILPVHLQLLSKKNKQRIIDRIKSEQEKNDEDEYAG